MLAFRSMRPSIASFSLLACVAASLVVPRPVHATAYQLTWGLPRPVGTPVRGMAFLDDANGWAVGDFGTVLRTADGGATWLDLSRFPANATHFTDLVVLANGDLVATGDGSGLYRSVDGGVNWFDVPHPRPGRLVRVRTLPGGMACAVGDSGRVLFSPDGGVTWNAPSSPGVLELHDAWWLDANRGFVVGKTSALRTVDGGAHWTAFQGTSTAPWNSVQFADSSHGLAYSDFYMGRTTNGGQSWTWTFLAQGPVYPDRVVFADSSHWWLGARLEGADLWEITQSGAQWALRSTVRSDGITALVRREDGVLVAATDAPDLRRSADGGLTWSDAIVRPGNSRLVLEVLSACGSIVIAGGYDPFASGGAPLLRSTDGGANWAQVTPAPATTLNDIHWLTNSTALLAGATDAVSRSTDGGATWTAKPLTLGGLNAGQRAMRFSVVDSLLAFVGTYGPLGSGGVFRTIDGGLTWQRRDTGLPGGPKRGLSFANALVGWAGDGSGSVASVWRTTDGGATWLARGAAGLTSPVVRMHAIDANTCLAGMLGNGGLWRTTNGGTSWSPVLTGALTGLAFRDPMHGYATTSGLYETSDGGATWTAVPVPITGPLAVAVTPDGFVVTGSQSRILIGRAGVLDVPGGGASHDDALRLRVLGSGSAAVTFAATGLSPGDDAIDVFDVGGRRVASVALSNAVTGARARWDAREAGAPSGVYFARLRGAHGAARFVILR